MEWKTPRWFDAADRSAQLDEHIDRTDVAHFGYRRMPTAEKVDWVRRHFNRVAPKYDLMNTLLSFGIQYAWKRAAIRMMGLSTGDRVLDVCGGTADLSIMASRRTGADGRCVVYDINRAMLQAGQPKVRETPCGERIQFVQGDAERIPYPDHSFDATMVGFGIRNVTHMEQGFREMHRVLKPGGYFVITFSNRWFSSKVIQLWTELHPFERMGLVLELFHQSGRFTDLETFSSQGWPRPEDDPYAHQMLFSDPVFAVWARRS